MIDAKEVEALRGMDALDRVSRAGELIEEYRQAMATAAQIRSEAVAELKSNGMPIAEIARHLNVTRQQVNRLHQAAASGPG